MKRNVILIQEKLIYSSNFAGEISVDLVCSLRLENERTQG